MVLLAAGSASADTVLVASRERCPDPDHPGQILACTPPLAYTEALLGALFDDGHIVFDAGFDLPEQFFVDSDLVDLRELTASAGAAVLVAVDAVTREEPDGGRSIGCFRILDPRGAALGAGSATAVGESGSAGRQSAVAAGRLGEAVQLHLAGSVPAAGDADPARVGDCWATLP